MGAVTEKRQLIFPELEATGWKRLEFSGETLKNPGQLKNISLTGFFLILFLLYSIEYPCHSQTFLTSIPNEI